jgi:hypothetical protein
MLPTLLLVVLHCRTRLGTIAAYQLAQGSVPQHVRFTEFATENSKLSW